ncbi:MAG: UbiA family prenyltransferase [Candidatus Atabeyarchaeum deiterrae]
MPEKKGSIFTVSRPEFIPANLGSLFLGLSWAVSLPIDYLRLGILVVLCFLTIYLISAYGAQLNTLSDYKLDLKDKRKEHLVRAVDRVGRRKIKAFIVAEFLLSLIPLYLLYQFEGTLTLAILWAVGVFLAYAYSMPPIRLKKRSWLQMIAIILVLSIIPMLFVFYTFAPQVNLLFIIFLSGQALTVYSVIIPTEIRDYFGDSAMKVRTMTVRLGLVKASALSMVLLCIGGVLCGAAFFWVLFNGSYPILNVFLLAIVLADAYVLRQYKKLYSLSKKFASNEKSSLANEITDLAASNPKWITIVTQSLVLMSLVLLVYKIFLGGILPSL